MDQAGQSSRDALRRQVTALRRQLVGLAARLDALAEREHALREALVRDMAHRASKEAELQDAARQREAFIAMLGHELRKPLGAIGAAVALQKALPMEEPRLAKARDVIERQTVHMTRMVEDIFDISRIARGRLHLETNRCNLASLVRGAVEDFRTLIAESPLTVELEVGADPMWVIADSTRIVQVLVNLLDNAAKFTPPPGRVQVAARITRDPQQGELAVVSVRDSGIGMDPAVAQRMFELFRQGHAPMDATQQGLGVGLALVKALVELHHGDVSAFSKGHGLGSSFVVRLPLAVAADQPGLTAAPQQARPG